MQLKRACLSFGYRISGGGVNSSEKVSEKNSGDKKTGNSKVGG